MTIERTGPTSWEMIVPAGYINVDVDIIVTAAGIEVRYQLITWEEIDAARELVCSTVPRVDG